MPKILANQEWKKKWEKNTIKQGPICRGSEAKKKCQNDEFYKWLWRKRKKKNRTSRKKNVLFWFQIFYTRARLSNGISYIHIFHIRAKKMSQNQNTAGLLGYRSSCKCNKTYDKITMRRRHKKIEPKKSPHARHNHDGTTTIVMNYPHSMHIFRGNFLKLPGTFLLKVFTSTSEVHGCFLWIFLWWALQQFEGLRGMIFNFHRHIPSILMHFDENVKMLFFRSSKKKTAHRLASVTLFRPILEIN